MAINYSTNLLRNVHEGLAPPYDGETFLIKGQYEYWHYGCDGFNDRVCNYSLQYNNFLYIWLKIYLYLCNIMVSTLYCINIDIS